MPKSDYPFSGTSTGEIDVSCKMPKNKEQSYIKRYFLKSQFILSTDFPEKYFRVV